MKKTAVIISILSLLFNSCNQNKPAAANIPVVGEAIDSAAIAQDTLQQKSIEQSYEYAQTVVVNPKLVYDIRAYGGPASHGEYAILRRGADNRPDTVVIAERFGTIENAFTADLNKNGNPEIYIVVKSADTLRAENIIAYEFNKDGKGINIDMSDYSKVEKGAGYKGGDSIFLHYQTIERHFPIWDITYSGEKHPCQTQGHGGCEVITHYIIKKNKLIIQDTQTEGPGIN